MYSLLDPATAAAVATAAANAQFLIQPTTNNTQSSSNEILPQELSNPTLRRGKWTVEEEKYTEKIISKFFYYPISDLLIRL